MDENCWADDDFEDTVARALIACFETKVKKNRGAAPPDRLTADRVAVLRLEGPYIVSRSRIFTMPTAYGKNFSFDMVNDRLPIKGLHAVRPSGRGASDMPSAYLFAHYIRQVQTLGKNWHVSKAGTLYEMLSMIAENDGIHGERRFFTVTKQGEVSACSQRLASIRWASTFGEKVGVVSNDNEWSVETSWWAGIALQAHADRRFCWTITAQEKAARAHLGCMKEEIKSLLYARSLPMTATGRKRPILHLVESHKRRMRNGTDVDVTAFLRGQQTVEIDGTVFKVNPPATLRQDVSASSQDRYFSTASVLG